jgi:hypothetical protein
MPFTYDITTNRGKVRALIPDRLIVDTNGDQAYFFDDAEIDYLLTAEGNVVKKAAALGLEIMASDEAYVQKALKLLDLTTNGPAVAAELRARAALLRAQAEKEEADSTTVAEFDWAEWVVNDFSGRERLDAEALRDG